MPPLTYAYSAPRVPYDEASKSTQYRRQQTLKQFSKLIDCPPSPSTHFSPPQVQHLGPHARRHLRELDATVPSDATIDALHHNMDKQLGTESKEFECGAYVLDPLLLVKNLTSDSSMLVVGGDYGGDSTKLGITFVSPSKIAFLPLYLLARTDKWENLHRLRGDYYPFHRSSSHCPDIWSVLQSIIDSHSDAKPVFLNGDWVFLNTVLGIQSPSALYPCPICVVCSDDFTSSASPRSESDRHSRQEAEPLLRIIVDRIVPLPLHLFLGLGNRILSFCMDKLNFPTQSDRDSALSSLFTTHSRGCTGAGDRKELNGPELSRVSKKNILPQLAAAAAASAPTSTRAQSSTSADASSSIHTTSAWLEPLRTNLLGKGHFSEEEIEQFKSTIHTIQTKWEETTGTQPFPKLHMLRHAGEFAEKWQVLGSVSESALESAHATANSLYHNNHRNLGNKTNTRLLRTLRSMLYQI